MINDITITPTVAQKILDNQAYEGQRPLSRYHVGFLAQEMIDGRFDGRAGTLKYAVNGTRKVLVDGYHRLEAVVKSGTSQVMRVTEILFNGDAELALIYARIDQGRKRSISDTFGAFGLDDDVRIDKTNMNRLASAVRQIQADFGPRAKRVPLDLHKELIEEWAPEMRIYLDLFPAMEHYDRMKFLTVPVLAVALVTLRHQQEAAIEFWKGAMEDDGLRANDPRKAFLAFLSKYARGHTKDYRTYLPTREYMRYVARAWNHWFEGNTVTNIRVRKDAGEVEIAGTPYAVQS